MLYCIYTCKKKFWHRTINIHAYNGYRSVTWICFMFRIYWKKNVVEFTFKRKHFFQMFFALFSRATRLLACKKLAEFPVKSLWIRERWLNMQDYSRLYVAWVLYMHMHLTRDRCWPPTEFFFAKELHMDV